MKKIYLAGVVLLPVFFSCSNNAENSTGKPENDIDAATMFIRRALDGKWKEARKLIVPDSANIEDIEVAEQNYNQRVKAEDQHNYRVSQITVHDSRRINDSATVVIYSNTFKNQRDSVKAVRIKGDWLIDLKYSFPNANASPQ